MGRILSKGGKKVGELKLSERSEVESKQLAWNPPTKVPRKYFYSYELIFNLKFKF